MSAKLVQNDRNTVSDIVTLTFSFRFVALKINELTVLQCIVWSNKMVRKERFSAPKWWGNKTVRSGIGMRVVCSSRTRDK